jgi:hypothetical protein
MLKQTHAGMVQELIGGLEPSDIVIYNDIIKHPT